MNSIYSALDAIDHMVRVRAGIFATLVIVSVLFVLQISIILSLRALRLQMEKFRAISAALQVNELALRCLREAGEKSLVEGQTTLPSDL